MLLTILSTAGIALFAGSGALVGVRKGFDLWGIVTVGVLTGVGGGILRDLLVGITPPTSLVNWLPISTAVIASLAVFKFHPSLAEIGRPVEILDALGVGLFASVGASIAVDVGANAFTATLVGLLTAIGGGIIRDVLVNDVPLLLQPSELYAIPALTRCPAGTALASRWAAPPSGMTGSYCAITLLTRRFSELGMNFAALPSTRVWVPTE